MTNRTNGTKQPQKQKKKRRWTASRKLLTASALMLAVAVVQYVYMNASDFVFDNSAQTMRLTDTEKGVRFDFNAGAQFYSPDARFYYFCTKDGMKYISANGDLKWQAIFNLTRPVMVSNGETVAVGDESNANHIYVFNTDGLWHDVTFTEPVSFFSVNRAGYLSVLQTIDKGYAARVYDKDGGIPFQYYMHDANCYPTAIAASEDGKYAVVAYMDLRFKLTSHVAFYYTSLYDSWYTDEGFFSSDAFDGQIISCVRFMSDNRVIVVTDTQIVCYKLGGDPALTESWRLPLHNKIDQIAFYGDNRFAIALGDKLLNDDQAVAPGTIRIYHINGEKTGEFTLGQRASYLSMGCDALIVGADRRFYALNANGGVLWEYTALQDTRQMIFLDNTDTVLFAAGTQATVMKRARVKTTTAPVESEGTEDS